MSDDVIIRIIREALLLVILLSAPPMLASMVVGFLVGVLQATTQIQEQTLSYVPKLIVIFLTLAIAAPWIILQAVRFATVLLETIPMVR